MPSQQTHATIFQDDDFFFTGHLVVPQPQVVIRRAINMATPFNADNNPLTSITFDNPDANSGTPASDILVGMTVKIYHQNTSTVKGYLRVAYGGSSSSVLQVNEFNRFDVDIADNDRFEVLREWTIWDVLVAASEDFEKDSRRAYVDEGTKMPPVANSGGPYVNFINPSTGLMTADFWGDESFKVPQNLSSTLTHLWTFGSGCTPTTSTSANPSGVTIPAGQRVISHQVTDANGKATTQYTFVAGLEESGSNAPYPIRMETIEGEDIDGYVATFSMPLAGLSTVANMPYGSLIIYFEREYRGGSLSAYGSDIPGRSHIKFVGYLDSESISIDPETNTLTFEARGPLSMLEQIPALPQLVMNKVSPDSWQEMQELTIWMALWYIVYWGSTFNLVHDFHWPDGDAFAYTALDIQGATIADQLRDIARSINVEVRCDRLGNIYLVRNVNQLDDSDRNARTVTYDLTSAEYIGVEWEQKHRRSVRLVQGEGIKFGDNPVFAWAPGKAPGRGWVTENLDKQILKDAEDLRKRVGHRAAEIEGSFYVSGTKSVKLVPQGVEVRLPGTMDVFDVGYGEYVKLILPASTNKRGVSFDTNDRFKLKSHRVEYDVDAMSKTVTLVLDHETKGMPGTIIPKTTYANPNPNPIDFGGAPFDPNLIVTVPPVYGIPIVTTGIQAKRILVLGTAGPYCARGISETGFITLGMSTYEDISSGLSGQCILAHVDPHDFELFYILTSAGLFRGRPGATPFAGWSQVSTNLQIFGNSGHNGNEIRMSISLPGWMSIRSGDKSFTTLNVGAASPSWTGIAISGGSSAGDITSFGWGVGGMFPGLNNTASSQWMYATTGAWPTFTLWRIGNWGMSGSWASQGTFGGTVGSDVIVPYKRFNGALNTSDLSIELIYGAGVQGTGQDSLARTGKGDIGSTVIDRWLTLGWASRRALVMSDNNPMRVYTGLVGQPGSGLRDLSLAYTLNGVDFNFSTPAFVFSVSGTEPTPAYGITLNPSNENWALMYVAGHGPRAGGSAGQMWNYNTGGLKITLDNGANWIDMMTGTNLATILTTSRVAYAQIF